MTKNLIDSADRRIISALDMDARVPLSILAKSCRLSRSTAEYRIKRLEALGIINGYYAVTDPTKLGLHHYRLRIKYRDVDLEKEKEIIEYCRIEPNFIWAARLEGNWDFIAVILSKSPHEYKNIERKFLFRFGHHIRENNESIAISIQHLAHNYLYKEFNNSCFTVGENPNLIQIDQLDYAIISELTLNARISFIELQKRISASPNTIKYRIGRLEKSKIILGYRSKINISELGYQHYKIYLYLSNLTSQVFSMIISYLKSKKSVVYITEAIGEGDLEYEVQVKNSNEIYSMLRELSSEFKGIIKDYYVLLMFKDINLGNKNFKSFESS